MYRYIEKDRQRWDFTAISAVVVVFLIIIAEYYAFIFVFAGHLFATSALLGVFLLIEIHFFIAMLFWSYIRVITAGAGYISPQINEAFSNVEEIKERQKLIQKHKFTRKNADKRNDDSRGIVGLNDNNNANQYVEDIESNAELDDIKKVASNPMLQLKETGFCFKCNRVKIPRAHHCKQCSKCVLRMDHHCPWTGNCIGLYNHKFFILFLIYAFLTIMQIFLWQSLIYLLNAFNFQKGLNSNQTIIIQVSLVASGGLSLAIGCLAFFQIYISVRNVTTVEHHIEGIFERNPFDKGTRRNLEEIFGVNHSTWMWPVAPELPTEENLFLSKNY